MSSESQEKQSKTPLLDKTLLHVLFLDIGVAKEKSVKVTLTGRSLRWGNESCTLVPGAWHKAEGLLGGVELAKEDEDIKITKDFNVAVENVDGGEEGRANVEGDECLGYLLSAEVGFANGEEDDSSCVEVGVGRPVSQEDPFRQRKICFTKGRPVSPTKNCISNTLKTELYLGVTCYALKIELYLGVTGGFRLLLQRFSKYPKNRVVSRGNGLCPKNRVVSRGNGWISSSCYKGSPNALKTELYLGVTGYALKTELYLGVTGGFRLLLQRFSKCPKNRVVSRGNGWISPSFSKGSPNALKTELYLGVTGYALKTELYLGVTGGFRLLLQRFSKYPKNRVVSRGSPNTLKTELYLGVTGYALKTELYLGVTSGFRLLLQSFSKFPKNRVVSRGNGLCPKNRVVSRGNGRISPSFSKGSPNALKIELYLGVTGYALKTELYLGVTGRFRLLLQRFSKYPKNRVVSRGNGLCPKNRVVSRGNRWILPTSPKVLQMP
ncbi:hypothetical protein SESBI_45002 [Sesbania bispinosa]|nr:hypothetical protein SESBI_45002 [Sesbania bispinosa]